MERPPYVLKRPNPWASGVIFASPHSGMEYPDWFLTTTSLPIHTLRSSEDAFVDQLIDCAPQLGAVALAATMPRSIIDLNRSAREIDPLLVRGTSHHPVNQRTLAGLGVIPRVVAHGRKIHHQKIDREEADRRLRLYWAPYHKQLRALIDEARALTGQAILIDMHSMPEDARAHLTGTRPDIVLGNRHGMSSSAAVLNHVAAAFETEGFVTRRNSPFSGAYICSAYGRPSQNVHVVQVEMARDLYMHEGSITPKDCFSEFIVRIARVMQSLMLLGSNRDGKTSIAAE